MAPDTTTLGTALDQLVDLVSEVGDNTDRPTPCEDWTVGDLVDHLVADVRNFTLGVLGEEVDWSAPTPHVEGDRARVLREASDGLLAAWAGTEGDADEPPPEWQCAELAVHTWDLATALDRDTGDLDPTVAERGGDFMRQGLTDENRGRAFGPARPEPDGADAYTRLAAFAGREV